MKFNYNPRHFWSLLYYIFYLFGFFYIESIPITDKFHLLNVQFDELIPFCEYFIIPYFIWFIYFPGVWLYLILFDKDAFPRYTIYLFSGMTLFIIISLIFPNYIELRIDFDHDKNICTKICAFLQKIDTPSNVFPSIHVFNSIVSHIGICKSRLSNNKKIRYTSFIIMVMICIGTLFLKQHSIIDFAGGIALAAFLYIIIYIIHPKLSK